MPQKLKPRAMEWFEDRVYESFLKNNTRVIFVDHLHYLVDLARQNRCLLKSGPLSGD